MVATPRDDRDRLATCSACTRILSSQPAIAAFLDDRVRDAGARLVAFELVEHLLAAYARWVAPVARLTVVEIDRAEAEGGPTTPATRWTESLPLAVAEPHRAAVSAAVRAVAGAAEARRVASAPSERAPTRGRRGYRRTA